MPLNVRANDAFVVREVVLHGFLRLPRPPQLDRLHDPLVGGEGLRDDVLAIGGLFDLLDKPLPIDEVQAANEAERSFADGGTLCCGTLPSGS